MSQEEARQQAIKVFGPDGACWREPGAGEGVSFVVGTKHGELLKGKGRGRSWEEAFEAAGKSLPIISLED